MSKQLRIQQFRTNDLNIETGKQIEFGYSWCSQFFEIPDSHAEISLKLYFVPLTPNEILFSHKEIELLLSSVSNRGDRKAYRNGNNGYSQLKDFFITDLKLTVEKNAYDYFALYKINETEYNLFYIPQLLCLNFISLFDDDSINLSKFSHIYSQDGSKKQRDNLQQIYYGAPGTGKSHEINSQTKGESVIRTTFHPDSDYSTFVGAYKPTTKSIEMRDVTGRVIKDSKGNDVKEDRIVYEFVSQAFLQAYIQAWINYAEAGESETPHKQYLVIEEINRGNCAQIFGDLFQLLDRNDAGFSEYPIKADNDMKKQLKKAFDSLSIPQAAVINEFFDGQDIVKDVLEGDVLLLPNNLYIWATMNTSDQSLFPIDSAFKRRWDWKYIPIDTAKENWIIRVNGSDYSWTEFLNTINEIVQEKTQSEDKQLGFYFCKAKDGVINADKFVGKVLFYLWNDVFKDYGFDDDIFNDEKLENGTFTSLTFKSFYDCKTGNVKEEQAEKFLINLKLTGIKGKEPEQRNDEDINDPTELTKFKELRKNYWDAFLKYANAKSSEYVKYFAGRKTPSTDKWYNFSIGYSDCHLTVEQTRSRNELAVELYFDETSENYYKLLKNREAIERELGFAFEWREMPDRKASNIILVKPDVDFEDLSKRTEQFDYIIEKLLSMRKVFTEYLSK